MLTRVNEKQIFEQSNGIIMLAKQALSFLKSNLFFNPSSSSTVILYLASIATSLCKGVKNLLDLVETCKLIYIKKNIRQSEELSQDSLADAEKMLELMQDDVDIWEEEPENSSNLRRGSLALGGQVPSAMGSSLVSGNTSSGRTSTSIDAGSSSKILAGSLNKLIEALTSDTQYGMISLHQ